MRSLADTQPRRLLADWALFTFGQRSETVPGSISTTGMVLPEHEKTVHMWSTHLLSANVLGQRLEVALAQQRPHAPAEDVHSRFQLVCGCHCLQSCLHVS